MIDTVAAQGRFYLVDAHAYLHRSYHAVRLTTSSGRPVGALYGFAGMLLGLLKKESPDFVAVCFDAPGPTFRHKAFAEYKATRKELDEDLKEQLALARPLAEAMGFKCVELPGYEADDLMATLASRAGRSADVVLVTPDKDACQLVGERVRVLRELKETTLDGHRVREKFGVTPEQMVDYLTIVGDASDNVPGVPGVGPVGAVKLLNEYDTLDRILQAARSGDSGMSPKVARALCDAEKQARLSRDLIRLNRDAPVQVDLKECRIAPVRADRLLPLLKQFEFKSLIRELFPDAAETASSSSPQEQHLGQLSSQKFARAPHRIAAPVALKVWLKAAAGAEQIAVAFCRMPPAELLGGSDWALALGLPDGKTSWIEPADVEKNRAALARIFKVELLGHDLKPVLTMLKRQGMAYSEAYFDTWLAAYCLDPAARYEFSAVMNQYGNETAAAPNPDSRQRALEEVEGVWVLAERLKLELKEKELLPLYEELEIPLIEVLAEMEAEGIGLDGAYLKNLRGEFESRILALKREIDQLAGQNVNPNSPKQLGKLLFEDLKLPVVHKTPKGGASTDEETLQALSAQHPLPAKLLEYRELAKLQSTYVDGLLQRMDPGTFRVHTHFNQAGTATGRLSSLDPNLQNIPIRTPLGQKIRRAFIPKEGCIFLSGDYSQIDLRVLAHLSQDPALTAAFKNNEDVHLQTACEIFGAAPGEVDAEMRRRAKAVNFGIVYGQTAHGLSQELGIPIVKAKEYIEKYFARYAGVAEWSKATLETARRDGYVRTILGRIRYLPDIGAKNTQLRLFSERVAINTPIQGSSADIIKKAMANIHRKMQRGEAVQPPAPDNALRGQLPQGEVAHPSPQHWADMSRPVSSDGVSEGAQHWAQYVRPVQHKKAPGVRGEGWKARLVLQVHDELLFETPEKEAEDFGIWLKQEMEAAVVLKVPLVVDLKTGSNWQDMKKI